MVELNECYKKFAEENFLLGRKVIRTRSYQSRTSVKTGYVIKEWPDTRVSFLDGTWCTVWGSTYEEYKFTDEYDKDFLELRTFEAGKRKTRK